jgi:hypothetical protein
MFGRYAAATSRRPRPPIRMAQSFEWKAGEWKAGLSEFSNSLLELRPILSYFRTVSNIYPGNPSRLTFGEAPRRVPYRQARRPATGSEYRACASAASNTWRSKWPAGVRKPPEPFARSFLAWLLLCPCRCLPLSTALVRLRRRPQPPPRRLPSRALPVATRLVTPTL